MLIIHRLCEFTGLFSCCQSVRNNFTFLLELLESMNSSESPSIPTESEKQIVKQGNVKMQGTFRKIHFLSHS